MKYVIVIVLSIVFLGCSGEQMAHGITKTQIAMSGNKPPTSFAFANLETMRDYVFDTKDFSFSLPSATQEDYTVMGGWVGESMRDGKTIAMGVRKTIAYQVVLSTSRVSKYTENNRQLELNNVNYFRKKYPKRVKDFGGGHITTYSLSQNISNHGKENYPCTISESRDEYQSKFGDKRKKYKKFFTCYKFNPSRTKAKSVTVSLTYNKTIAKQYSYQDLKRRAKRTLDSLYIKDGW